MSYSFLIRRADHQPKAVRYHEDREESDYGLFGPLVDLDDLDDLDKAERARSRAASARMAAERRRIDRQQNP